MHDLISTVGTALLGASAAQTPEYALVDLSQFIKGPFRVHATAINDANQIVGWNGGPVISSAVLWDFTVPGVGTLIPGFPSGQDNSRAWGINNWGEIVGEMRDSADGFAKPFLYLPAPNHGLPAGTRSLGLLSAGSCFLSSCNAALDINDDGDVVGDSRGRGFWWSPGGGMVDVGASLGPPCGEPGDPSIGLNAVMERDAPFQATAAVGTGTYFSDCTNQHSAVRWTLGGGLEDVCCQSNCLAWEACIFSEAWDIDGFGNRYGRAAFEEFPVAFHAALWPLGAENPVNIHGFAPDEGSEVRGVNDYGEAVGLAEDGPTLDRAFHWSASTGMRDLNALVVDDLGLQIELAYDINELGVIVGRATSFEHTHAVMLVPLNLITDDCNSNSIPDEWERDCNGNGRPDDCDIPGDANGDDFVNFLDYLLTLSSWGPCPDCCAADFDLNGVVDVADLLIVLANWT